MATVAQLLTRVAENTGTQTTGSENTRALQALNNAYLKACRRTNCNEKSKSHTFVASQDDYTFSGDLSWTTTDRPMRLHTVVYSDGSAWPIPLKKTNNDALLAMRIDNASGGFARAYSTMGTDTMMFYPKPAIGDSITVRYVPKPPTLVASAPGAGEESTPTAVEEEFHFDVLAAGATVEMLRLDQRIDDAKEWDGIFEAGLADLKHHVETFSPPAPLWDGVTRMASRDPDQRGRF